VKFPPTIRRFQKDDSFVRMVIGPVGSGKSSACVLELIRRAQGQKPGPDGVKRSRFCVIRNTYGQLRDTTYKTFEQWVPDEIGTLEKQAFTWHGRWNDGKHDIVCEVLFRALDRPEDIKKLLSLELTGAYVNEVREIPKHVLDILETRIGRYPSMAEGGATWSGIWADTNPWHGGHWGAKLASQRLDGYAFFRQPGGRSPEAENVENLPPGYYDRLCRGKDAEWVRVYVDGEDASSDVGSVWGPWVDQLEKRGGICAFDHGKDGLTDGVFTNWDLGLSDATAIWFWRLNRHGVPDIIDHYEAHGEGLSHFFNIVDGKPYKYLKHWLPFDSTQKTIATQVSVYDQCCEHWKAENVLTAPKLDRMDGIQAVRWLLEQPVRIHERCTKPARLNHSGVEALREYRWEYDEDSQAFSRTPRHDWTSHTADALRYLALVVKHSDRLVRATTPREEPQEIQFPKMTFGDLMKDRRRELRRRGA